MTRQTLLFILRVFLLCLVFASGQVLAAEFSAKKHVLMVNSYHQRMPWVVDIVQGVVDVLQPDKNGIDFHVENMDSKKFNSEEYFRVFLQYLEVKYSETPVSLLLVSDNNAFDFFREYRDKLFPGVPVVFCGVNNFDQKMLEDTVDFTGVAEVFSARKTIELALELQPAVEKVYVINDYLKTGRIWANDIDKELKELGKVEVIHSENHIIDDLLQKVSALPPDTVVLLGAYFSDKNKEFFRYEQIAELLSKNSSVPVYCLVEFVIDEGLLGGHLISPYYQGQAMAKLASEILAGKAVSSIPVQVRGSNKTIVNYSQLARFGLSESSLSSEAVLINRPYSFYREYKLQVWVLGLFIISLVFTIFFLAVNIRLRKKAELRIKSSEEQFRQLANATWEAIVIHDDGVLLEANNLFFEMWGYSAEELKGQQILPLIFTEESKKEVEQRLVANDFSLYEAEAVSKDGVHFPIEVRIRKMEYDGRQVRVAAIRDLTRRKLMEEQLAQSQKLEAIGTLAGGIAHDFNNILSAIIGFSEISLLTIKKDSQVAHNLQQILNAGNRAKLLIEQILTFARRNEEAHSPVQVSRIIQEALKLLRVSIPSSIEIRENITSDSCVLSNETKIHQVVMNLCTNAAKAMSDGGILSISLREKELEKTFVLQHSHRYKVNYLHLVVQDTGEGIPEEFQQSVFDPFFTTKGKESGTGLGLSVVHGIVKECEGFITVQSDGKNGTIFDIYLPVTDQREGNVLFQSKELPQGSETILLVDDEELLVKVGEKTLGSLGYKVKGFTDSNLALNAFCKNPGSFDLVITDMTMPNMNGDALARSLLDIRPDIPIIICTGFSEQFTKEDAIALGVRRFIMKPVNMAKLTQTVRNVLDVNSYQS